MPLSLLNHSALALFAQRTRIPTSARSIGFCAIWVCISSSSSSGYFPSDEVQDETEVRGSTPVSANDWGKNTAAWPYSLSLLSLGPH